MQFPIYEDAALEFAHSFYGAIADGFPVDAAISEARKSIFMTGNETEWATPVLFMNSPDGKIFNLRKQSDQPPAAILEPGSAPVENGEGTPDKRSRKSVIWKRLVLGLALTALAAILGLWAAGRYFSPSVKASTHIPAPSVTSTSTLPTSTVTSTPSPIPTVTLTPVPSATPYPTEIRDPANVEMVLIPAGEFTMGSDEGEGDEKPAHPVFLDAYYIDKYEVTNELYELCVQLKICRRPIDYSSYQRLGYFGNPEYASYPVINVTYEMARKYCEDWRGARLPTEAEWEKAAHGADASTFPWGEGIDCNLANYRDKACKRTRDTVPVTSFENSVSDYGVYNMAGNVWEWVKDWYSPAYYLRSPDRNPTGPDRAVVGIYYIKRGGSFQTEWERLRATNREKNDPTNYGSDLGFRCVRPISDDFP